ARGLLALRPRFHRPRARHGARARVRARARPGALDDLALGRLAPRGRDRRGLLRALPRGALAGGAPRRAGGDPARGPARELRARTQPARARGPAARGALVFVDPSRPTDRVG